MVTKEEEMLTQRIWQLRLILCKTMCPKTKTNGFKCENCVLKCDLFRSMRLGEMMKFRIGYEIKQ